MNAPAPASEQLDTGNVKVALTPNGSEASRRPRTRSKVENAAYMAFLRRVVQAAGRRVAAGDVEALPLLVDLADELLTATGAGVAGLRAAGYSWADIGDRLGISRQAAWERWGTE